MSDTTSTSGIYQTLRTHLLDYERAVDVDTLRTRLDGRFYIVAAPDSVIYPYGVMRLTNDLSDGAYNGDRKTVDLEVQLFHRPRSQTMTLEACADLCDQAMYGYADASSGLLFSRERQRDTLPPFPEPADREVVQIRLLYPVVVWPRYITDLAA